MNENVLVPAFRQGVIIQLQNKVESLSNDIAYIETVLKTANSKRIHHIVIKNFKKRKEKQFKEFVQFYTKYSKFLLNKNYPIEPPSLEFQQKEQTNETPVSDTCSTCSTDVGTVPEEKEKYKLLMDMYDKKKKLIEMLHLLETNDSDFLGNKESLKILDELSTTLNRITSYVADTEYIPTEENGNFQKKVCVISKGKEKVSKSIDKNLDDKIINYLNNADASFPGMEGLIESSSSISNSERQYSNGTDINKKRSAYTEELSFKVMNLLKDNKSAIKKGKIKNSLLPAGGKTEEGENNLEGVKKNSILFPIENGTLDSSGSRKSNLIIRTDVTGSNLSDIKTKDGKYAWNLKKGNDTSAGYTSDVNKSVHFDLRDSTDDKNISKIKKEKNDSAKKLDSRNVNPIKEDSKKKTLNGSSRSSNKKDMKDKKNRNRNSGSISKYTTDSSSYTSSSSDDSSDSSYSSSSYSSSGYNSGKDSGEESYGRRKHVIKINRHGKGAIFHTERKGSSSKYINDFEIIYDHSNNTFSKIGSRNSSSDRNKTILKLSFLQNGKKIEYVKNLFIRKNAQLENIHFYNAGKKWKMSHKDETDIDGTDNNTNSCSIGDRTYNFPNGNNISDCAQLLKEISDIINNVTENKLRRLGKDKCIIETVETNRLRRIYSQIFEKQKELENEKKNYKNELDVLNKNLNKFLETTNDNSRKASELNFQRSELLYKALEEKFANVINAQLGVSQEMNDKEKYYLTREKELEKSIIELQCEQRMNREQLANEREANERLKTAFDADRIALANTERYLIDNENYKEEIKAMHQKCEELEKAIEIEREEKKQLNQEVNSQLKKIQMLKDELTSIKEDTTFDNFRKSVLIKVNNTNSEIQILADRIKTLTEELEIKKNKEKMLTGLFAKSKKENTTTKKHLKFSKEKLKHKENLINSMQQEIDYLNVKIENLLDSVKFLKRENEKHISRNKEMTKVTV